MMDFGLFNTWNALYAGGKVPWDPAYSGGKLLEEEAPVRIPGRDAQQAGSLGGWVRRQHPNETLAGSAWQQAQAASGGAVTRLARAPSAKRRSMSANGDRFCDG